MEAEEHVRRHRIARRRRAVGARFLPGDEPLGVRSREEVCTARVVVEPGIECRDQLPSTRQVARITARFVQIHERRGQEGVVVEIRIVLGPASRPDVQQSAVAPEPGPHEVGSPDGGVDEARRAQDAARLGECADRERVPSGQHLLVA